MPVEAANVLRRATTAWAHALVELGWPAAWPPGVRAYVTTYGAGQVTARAAPKSQVARYRGHVADQRGWVVVL